MRDVLRLRGVGKALFWGRMRGDWGKRELGALLVVIDSLGLAPGSQVVLDFADARHVDYRAVEMLIRLGRRLERKRSAFRLAGLNPYLRQIFELGGAVEGRDFVEQHLWDGPHEPTSRRAPRSMRPGLLRRLDADELAVPNPN